MKMTAEKIETAQRMRTDGMSCRAIGKALGMSGTTVECHLNPGRRGYYADYRAANKEEKAAYNAAYRSSHRDDIAVYNRAYRATHQNEMRASGKKWREGHKESISAQQAAHWVEYGPRHRERKKIYDEVYRPAYYAAHSKERLAYQRKYRRDNKEAIAARTAVYNATYRKAHRGESTAYEATRRALKAGTVIGATAAQLNEIKEIYRRAKEEPNIRCYLCGEFVNIGDRHVDHVVPLSRGGSHRPSNLAIACASCNMSKGSKTPEEAGLLL